ncbi:MAG: peptidylprolyl isomerase, partial [Salinivirgaceae bacterium]|nr:peptidylprolyl isomerase [Salinivirgaceae bacterium]
MKKLLFYISIVLLSAGLMSAKGNRKKPKPAFVLIETQYGNMKVKLYGETPLHKENFVTLVKEHFYDSLLFHRVIEDFMIQGGDPESKNAKKGAMLGAGSHGERIPAEFVDGKYHKRGALAAARDNNPEKKSSGCQFYIVQGKVYSNKDLDHIEEQHNASVKQKLLNDWLKSDASKADQEALTKLQRARNFAA